MKLWALTSAGSSHLIFSLAIAGGAEAVRLLLSESGIMAGSRDCGPRGPKMLAIVLATILLSGPFSVVQGLRTTPGSPCEDKCNKLGPTTNTTTSEISCLDSQYNQTKGRDFEDCITCELTSVYVDFGSGETDVDWGLCKSIAKISEQKQ